MPAFRPMSSTVCRQERVKPILDMAVSRFNAFSRMARELEEARSELESRKVIDRAKGILMKSRGLTEEAAYTLLRKTAMNQNRKIGDIAQSLVTAAGLLGTGGGRMSMGAEHQITAGFMPLFDSAVLVAAGELGFAAREGIDLTLHRETSWANIRDRIAIGHFHLAHMLGPMPLACNLGLTPLASETIVPFSLGLGGNCVTISNAVWAGMAAHGAMPDLDPARAGAALGAFIRERAAAGRDPLRFAVVHPHSGHNYELRYWLAACGIDPEREIEIVIVPPPFMADALAAGRIDGYCVGEPWNSASVAAGTGHIVTVKALLWRNSPEKVIGVRKAWARGEPATRWRHCCARCIIRRAGARIRPTTPNWPRVMAQPGFLGLPPAVQMPILTGHLQLGGGAELDVDDFFLPFDKAANFPWKSHALWFYTQMVRWGHVAHTPENLAIARDCYRPDLYRSALKPLGVALPGANAKVEGALKVATRGRRDRGKPGARAGRLLRRPDLRSRRDRRLHRAPEIGSRGSLIILAPFLCIAQKLCVRLL